MRSFKMQFSRYTRIYLIGLNLIILTILAIVLLLTPIMLWTGLFMITLSSGAAGMPEFIVTIEYILLAIFLPLCLALYFPILKILKRRFKQLKKIKESLLPAKFNVKDRFIMGSIAVLIVIIAIVFNVKAFLYFSCVAVLVIALRLSLVLASLRRELAHLNKDNRIVGERLDLIKDWIKFLATLSVVILVVLLKVLTKKLN